MKDFRNKVVVVTGAASGIGRAIARSFARRGARLVLADINPETLEDARREFESMGSEVYAQVVDVTKAADVASLCENTYDRMGRCDVLVNNAGVAMFGFMEKTTLEDWKWLIDINVWGVIHGCHFFYPRMIEQGGGGHIVNTASGAGLGPMPIQTVYCTSKYAVVGLSETLRGEAALHGIGVSAICPSFVSTNISKGVRWRFDTDRSPTEQHLVDKSVKLLSWRNYSPDHVGEKVVRAVEKDKAIVPVGAETYLMDFMHRTFRSAGRDYMKLGIRILRRVL